MDRSDPADCPANHTLPQHGAVLLGGLRHSHLLGSTPGMDGKNVLQVQVCVLHVVNVAS